MHHLGLHGMPRRVYTYLPETGWGPLNLLATVGAFMLALGVLVFIVNVLWSRRRGAVAGADPWGAGTLEWATASPPPRYNFRHLPTVRGREPLWENPPDTPVVTGLATDNREVLVTTTLDARPRPPLPHGRRLDLAVPAGGGGRRRCSSAWSSTRRRFPIGLACLLVVHPGLVLAERSEPEPIHHPRHAARAGEGPP